MACFIYWSVGISWETMVMYRSCSNFMLQYSAHLMLVLPFLAFYIAQHREPRLSSDRIISPEELPSPYTLNYFEYLTKLTLRKSGAKQQVFIASSLFRSLSRFRRICAIQRQRTSRQQCITLNSKSCYSSNPVPLRIMEVRIVMRKDKHINSLPPLR
jgi:hypothetical protein